MNVTVYTYIGLDVFGDYVSKKGDDRPNSTTIQIAICVLCHDFSWCIGEHIRFDGVCVYVCVGVGVWQCACICDRTSVNSLQLVWSQLAVNVEQVETSF